MFQKQKQNILRPPKVYNPPPEKLPLKVPKFVKIIAWAIVIILGLIYLIFFSPLFQVKNIEYIGSPNDDIKNIVEKYRGQNIFLVKTDLIEQELLIKNDQFNAVKIYLGLPDTLRVKFQERQSKILWETAGKFYFIDNDGFIFAEANESADLPKVVDSKNLAVKVPSAIVSRNFVDFILNAKIKLAELGITVNQFRINETTFQVEAETDHNFKIIFDTIRPLSEEIDAFKQAYDAHKDEIKEYVDVRVAGWVYYK